MNERQIREAILNGSGEQFCAAFLEIRLSMRRREGRRLYDRAIVPLARRALADMTAERLLEIAVAYAQSVANGTGHYCDLFLRPAQEDKALTLVVFELFARARIAALEKVATQRSPGSQMEQEGMALLLYALLAQSFERPLLLWRGFLEQVVEGDDRARRIFALVLDYYTNTQGVRISRLSQWQAPRSMSEAVELAWGSSETPSTLPIPDDLYGGVEPPFIEMARQYARSNELIQPFLQKVAERLSWFRQREQEMWQGIQENPRYGLHPDGSDVARIAVPELRHKQFSYERIQLFPEPEFPTAEAYVWMQAQGETFASRVELQIDRLFMPERVSLDDLEQRAALVGNVLSYMALHVYWLIVSGTGLQLAEQRSRHSISSEATSPGRWIERSPIRPHFRRLPSGFHMSEEARQRALDTFGTIPPQGRTFAGSRTDAPTLVFLRVNAERARNVMNMTPLFRYTTGHLWEA